MSCVYEISFENCDDFYIGSCKDLEVRKRHHKSDCFNENSKQYNKKLYQFIREKNYEWKEVVFEIVEQHDDILDSLELRKREQHFIDELKATLNHKKAYMSEEQYKEYQKKHYQENKEEKKEYKKKYRKENPEQIKEYNKKYREENPDYYKEYHKKHYEENKEDYKERGKKYREANKEKLHKKYDCCCKGKYTHQHKKRHLKSKKHQDYLDNLEKIII